MNGNMKEMAEKRLGFAVSEEQFRESEKRAENKLHAVIARFGDAGGRRREPGYWLELVCEDLKASALAAYTCRMEKSAPRN